MIKVAAVVFVVLSIRRCVILTNCIKNAFRPEFSALGF